MGCPTAPQSKIPLTASSSKIVSLQGSHTLTANVLNTMHMASLPLLSAAP